MIAATPDADRQSRGHPLRPWSANILIFGMKHARNLHADAALTVGIPVALYIAYILITLLGLIP